MGYFRVLTSGKKAKVVSGSNRETVIDHFSSAGERVLMITEVGGPDDEIVRTTIEEAHKSFVKALNGNELEALKNFKKALIRVSNEKDFCTEARELLSQIARVERL